MKLKIFIYEALVVKSMLGIVFLVSFNASAENTCISIFSETTFFKSTSSLENHLTQEADLFLEENKIKFSLSAKSTSFYVDGKLSEFEKEKQKLIEAQPIFIKYLSILKAMGESSSTELLQKFSKDDLIRMQKVMIGILLRTSKLLKTQGVSHTIWLNWVEYNPHGIGHIVIDTDSKEGVLGRLNNSLSNKKHLTLMFTTANLAVFRASAYYYKANFFDFGKPNGPIIVLDPFTLVGGSLFRNHMTLHENWN